MHLLLVLALAGAVRCQFSVVDRPPYSLVISDFHVIEGRHALITCSSSGHPAPTIEWFSRSDGADYVAITNTSHLYVSPWGELIFTSFHRSEHDRPTSYRCQARNKLATIYQDVYPVIGLKPTITSLIRNRTLPEGSNVTLSCGASGHPAPQYTWYHGSIGFSNIKSRGPTLQLALVTPSDSGWYFCSTDNWRGQDIREMYLEVEYKPKVSMSSEVLHKNYKDTVQILCTFSCLPPPSTILWLKNNMILRAGSRHIVEQKADSETSLTLLDAVPDDSGVYTCFIKNGIGSGEAFVKLTVKGPPGPPVNLSVVEVFATNFTISWQSGHSGNTGIVGFTILIIDRDKVIKSLSVDEQDGKKIALLNDLKPATKYTVRIAGVNSFGRGELSNGLQIRTHGTVPGQPVIVNITTIDYGGMTLKWQLDDDGGDKIMLWLVQYRPHLEKSSDDVGWQDHLLKDSSTRTTKLQNLSGDKAYQVRVRGRNIHGDGPFSDTVIFSTASASNTNQADSKVDIWLYCGIASAAAVIVVLLVGVCKRQLRKAAPSAMPTKALAKIVEPDSSRHDNFNRSEYKSSLDTVSGSMPSSVDRNESAKRLASSNSSDSEDSTKVNSNHSGHRIAHDSVSFGNYRSMNYTLSLQEQDEVLLEHKKKNDADLWPSVPQISVPSFHTPWGSNVAVGSDLDDLTPPDFPAFNWSGPPGSYGVSPTLADLPQWSKSKPSLAQSQEAVLDAWLCGPSPALLCGSFSNDSARGGLAESASLSSLHEKSHSSPDSAEEKTTTFEKKGLFTATLVPSLLHSVPLSRSTGSLPPCASPLGNGGIANGRVYTPHAALERFRTLSPQSSSSASKATLQKASSANWIVMQNVNGSNYVWKGLNSYV